MNYVTWRHDYPPPPAAAPAAQRRPVPLDSSAPSAATPAGRACARDWRRAGRGSARGRGRGGGCQHRPAPRRQSRAHPRARGHRRARPGGQPGRRRAAARGPAGITAGEGQARAGAAAEPRQRRVAVRAAGAASPAAPAPRRRPIRRCSALRRANCGWPTGQDELRLPLTWTDGQGVTVTKTYIFRRGSYAIGLEYAIENAAASAVECTRRTRSCCATTRRSRPRMFNADSYAFKGPAYYDGTKYQKLKIDDKDTALDRDISGGWLAALQHHFVAAIVPPAGERWRYKLDGAGQRVPARGQRRQPQRRARRERDADARRCSSARSCRRSSAAGPRPGPGRRLRHADVLAQPLFWLLDKVHTLVRQLGLSRSSS